MATAILSCSACKRQWPFGVNIGHFERQSLEAAACPSCGSHTLRCVRAERKVRSAVRIDPEPLAITSIVHWPIYLSNQSNSPPSSIARSGLQISKMIKSVPAAGE